MELERRLTKDMASRTSVDDLQKRLNIQELAVSRLSVELAHINEQLKGIKTVIERIGWTVVLAVIAAILSQVIARV